MKLTLADGQLSATADAAFSSASGKGVFIYCLSSSGNTWLAW